MQKDDAETNGLKRTFDLTGLDNYPFVQAIKIISQLAEEFEKPNEIRAILCYVNSVFKDKLGE